MTVRRFVMWPDARLKARAVPVDAVTNEIGEIWADMVDTMEAMPGVGLAAPQIGVPLRLAVIDASDTRGQAILMANPVLVTASDETSTHPEASPNLPGVHAKITRPARVTVSFLGADGCETQRDFDGLWATSVQHQIDHLEGRMYFDNLSRTKREMLIRRARKAAR